MADRNLSLPGLFIAGAPKSGTSSVFRWLADHPQAQGSTPKETCFFADRGSHVFRPDFHSGLGLDRYAAAFPPAPPQVLLRFEGTASYLYSETALHRIPDLPNKPKCLFILREPAAQILSTYTYFRNNWNAIPADMSFTEFLAALEAGRQDFGGNELVSGALEKAGYASWLLRWRDRLGAGRMKVLTFDALLHEPRAVMTDLALWTEIDPAFYATHVLAAENESYAPISRGLQRLNIALRDRLPKGPLYDMTRRLYRQLNTRAPTRDADADAMAALRARFAPANRRLADEFGLDLSGWG